MKNTIFTVAIGIIIATSGCFAQPERGGMPPPTIEERLKMVNEKICQPLKLNPTQTEKVGQAFKEFFKAMDKLMDEQARPPAPPERSKVEPLEKIRDAKVKQVIPKALFARYLELEESARPKPPREGIEQGK